MNHDNLSRNRRSRLSTPVRLGVAAVAACFLAAPLLAAPPVPTTNLPTNLTNLVGIDAKNIVYGAKSLDIVTSAARSAADVLNFNIATGYRVGIVQPSASANVLFRVLSSDPSVIYGSLSSNGGVYLVNPNGLFVGSGGQVDVARFVATTLGISNADFLAGRNLFVNDGNAKDVINQGEITTPAGGSVYLIGSNVANEGIITTPKGETILAAGATVSLIDSALPGVKVDITGAAGNSTNLGTITAEAGRIGIAGVIVRNSGTLNASSLVADGGRIFLKASQDAYVDGNGRIVTTGTKGGSVEVLGNRVAVMDNASIDASATSEGGDGGKILVGGDYQGKNPDIQNASITYFGPNASLKADAGKVGDGGTVIVWADDTTRAYGNISARGGAGGGNGGFVETSGMRHLDFRANVDTTAPLGKTGTLLLDPTNVYIAVDQAAATAAGMTGTDFAITTGGGPIFAAAGASDSLLTWGALSSALGSNNVVVHTDSVGGGSGDIFVANGTYSYGTTYSLSLLAQRHIAFLGGMWSNGSSGAINMIAGWDGNFVTPAPTGTVGDVQLNNTIVSAASGNMKIVAAGAVTLTNGSRLTNGGAFQWVEAKNGNLQIVGGTSGTTTGIEYYGTGAQTVYGASIVLQGENTIGSSFHGAGIYAANAGSSQTVAATAGGISLTGGGYLGVGINNYASIQAAGAQTVSATGAITLVGGAGASGNFAYISAAGTQDVTAASMTLAAGTAGYGAGAYIRGDGNQHLVTTAGSIVLSGAASGTFYGGYATIVHGSTSGNQLIEITGGDLIVSAGSGTGLAYGGAAASLVNSVCAADSSCLAQGVSANYAGIDNRVGTTTLDMNTGNILLNGGTGGIKNQAYLANSSAGAQTILDAGAITLTGGGNAGTGGGSGYVSTDGFHYLTNNASIFSPAGSQSITATSLTISGTAAGAHATTIAGAGIHGLGQTINLGSGALTMTASATATTGGGAWLSSGAGQSITAGAIALYGGMASGGYDNTASIDQVGTGAYSQSLTATSLTLQGGSGNGAGNNAGDCGAACNGLAAHNSAGVYSSGSGGQTVNVGGAISLIAGTVGNGNKAYIQNRSASLQTINAGSIYMQGGDSGGLNSVWMFGQGSIFGGSWLANNASITSGWSGGLIGSQSVTSAGAITIKGNSGAGTGGMGGAGIGATGTQSISGGAIALTGGAGVGSYESSARIGSLGQQTINGTTLVVQGGVTGTGNRASVTGYGQTINLAGSVLTVYGGGSTNADQGNTAEIMNFGGSGQSITFSAAATMTVHGGAGWGYAPYGGSECGALCDNLSSWNSAQVGNESGNQTITFQGGGSLLVTGGSNGNDNYANIQNRTSGTQSILGNPIITLARGASGGTAVWGQQQVASSEHPVGAWRWFELTNDAGIDSDGAQIINASTVTLDSKNSTGTAYGGTFISGKTQNITAVTGAVTLWGGNEGITSAIYGGAPYNADIPEFLFVAPAVIGYDGAGHSLTINANSVMLNGAGWGAYGGSPALIGTYRSATNTTINTTGGGGIVLNAIAPSSALVGSFFGDGGQVTLNAGSTGPITLTDSEVGTGSSGSTTLIGTTVTQTAGGLVYTPLLDITTNNGIVDMSGLNQASTVNLDTGTGVVSYLSGQSVALNLAATTTGALYVTTSDPVSGGDISIYKSGDMALSANKGFTSGYGGDIFVAATNNLTYTGAAFSNVYGGAYGGVGLAANSLDISSALAPNGGNSAIILAGANVNINAGVTGQDIGLVAGSLTVGNTGWLLATNSLVAVVAGDVNINGGYIKTSAGDLEMLIGGDLNIGNASYGGSIWAGETTLGPYFPDASIAVGGDLKLNNGAYIKAANDVYLDLMGSTSTLVLNDGTVGYAPSYVMSDIKTLIPATTHLSFLGRSTGGVVINGIETTTTVVGGSGFFAVNSSTPATAGAGLQITYSATNQDLCAISPDLCSPKPPADTPIDEPPPSFEITGPGGTKPADPSQGVGGTEGSFGGEEGKGDKKDDKKDDKDKKSDQAKDDKKDDKPGQKKVAQCS